MFERIDEIFKKIEDIRDDINILLGMAKISMVDYIMISSKHKLMHSINSSAKCLCFNPFFVIIAFICLRLRLTLDSFVSHRLRIEQILIVFYCFWSG